MLTPEIETVYKVDIYLTCSTDATVNKIENLILEKAEAEMGLYEVDITYTSASPASDAYFTVTSEDKEELQALLEEWAPILKHFGVLKEENTRSDI